jgi:hypothetical protein
VLSSSIDLAGEKQNQMGVKLLTWYQVVAKPARSGRSGFVLAPEALGLPGLAAANIAAGTAAARDWSHAAYWCCMKGWSRCWIWFFLFAGRAPFKDLRFKKEVEDGGRGSNNTAPVALYYIGLQRVNVEKIKLRHNVYLSDRGFKSRIYAD